MNKVYRIIDSNHIPYILVIAACCIPISSCMKVSVNRSLSSTDSSSLASTLASSFVSSSPSSTPSPSVSSSVPSVPILDYSASTGRSGFVNLALSISPSTFSNGGQAMTSCKIKTGSANAGSFPSTLAIDPATCKITGTPTAALASTQFTIVATNSAGDSNDAQVTLSVDACDVLGATYGGGSAGTSGDPYQICSPTHLDNVRLHVSSYFILKRSLDLTSFSLNPIATSGSPFTGTFDGNGLEISNWSYNSSATSYVGLFAAITTGATLKNITLTNVTVSGNTYVGALVGAVSGTAQITNCSSSGSVMGQGNSIGGLIGVMNNATVTNSSSSASVTGISTSGYLGGLIGNTGNGAHIIHCHATGNVLNGSGLGGLSGNFGNPGTSITQSYATGSVTGTTSVGGLTSIMAATTVTDSYATGAVTATSPTGIAGGLVANYWHSATVTNVYATGKVTVGASGHGGGLAGVDSGGAFSTLTHVYWDQNTTGMTLSPLNATYANSSVGALTTSQMQDPINYATTFVGWDFSTVWNPPTATSYPTLR